MVAVVRTSRPHVHGDESEYWHFHTFEFGGRVLETEPAGDYQAHEHMLYIESASDPGLDIEFYADTQEPTMEHRHDVLL